MTPSREVAFFGGWHTRALAGGDHAWDSPFARIQEIAPSVASGLILPPHSPWRQRGVPYWLFNTGSANLAVKRSSDLATVWTVSANTYAVFMLGSGDNWHHVPNSFSLGSVYPALRMTIDVTQNVANLNILQRAIALGYDGTQPVAVTCRVRSGVAIGSATQGARALTTGNTVGAVSWASGSFVLLTIEVDAIVGGWGGGGGRGGIPGTGSSGGFNGESGGQAVRAEIPLRIECFGLILGGGGGGGGGGSGTTSAQLAVRGGGGGGGRGANMASTGALLGSPGGGATSPAQTGPGGGPFGPGAQAHPTTPGSLVGGLGASGGGNGGAGGAAAAAGSAGAAATTGASGGTGGAAGAAISYLPAAGAPTILSGGGFISGSSVSEAS